MKKYIEDKINGYGPVFRFITPVLLVITMAMTGYVLSDIKEVRKKLSHHLEFTIPKITSRLLRVEMKQQHILDDYIEKESKASKAINHVSYSGRKFN